MGHRTVIFGYGPVGRQIAARLSAAGDDVVVAQRGDPGRLPQGARFTACDLLERGAARAAARGAGRIIMAAGLPYEGRVWREGWPRVMEALLDAAQDSGARTVFVDNLYMYGPRDEPLREDTPLADHGVKPAARAAVTRMWRRASDEGRVRFAALRASDFFGPGVAATHMGDGAFGAVARGRPAALLLSPDLPHDFAYVPDVAAAAEALLDGPDEAFGRAWHVPCAPTRTPRDLLEMGAAALGGPLRVNALPPGLLPLFGLVSPMMREAAEMRFVFARPYRVDGSAFAAAFGFTPTPFEVSVPETARAFAAAASHRTSADRQAGTAGAPLATAAS